MAGVNNDKAATTFMLFPNPVRQRVTVPLGMSPYSNASIMSIDGKLIASFAIDDFANELVIDISPFAAGEYLVLLRGSSVPATAKLIVR